MAISGIDIRKRLDRWRGAEQALSSGDHRVIGVEKGLAGSWFAVLFGERIRVGNVETLALRHLIFKLVCQMLNELNQHLSYIAGLENECAALRTKLDGLIGDDASSLTAPAKAPQDTEAIEDTLQFLSGIEFLPGSDMCPCCRNLSKTGHAEGCKLNALQVKLWTKLETALPPVAPPPKPPINQNQKDTEDDFVWVFGD